MQKMKTKKTLLTLLLLVWSFFGITQTLSIDQTIDYLNGSFKKNSHPYHLSLSTNGELTIIRYSFYSVRIKKDINPRIVSKAKMHWSEIDVNKETFPVLSVELKCKNRGSKCLSTSGYKKSSKAVESYLIFSNDNYLCDKIINAFKYLLYELKISEKYNRNDDDPFAVQNFNSNLYSISSYVNTDKIKLETYGGIYKIWGKIGDLKQHFILDSGASDISISKKTENELIKQGIIRKNDYIEPALYSLADGSIIKCRRLIIPEITVGKFRIRNVLTSVGTSNSPLLLGKSFLDKFKKWSVNNHTNELILEN